MRLTIQSVALAALVGVAAVGAAAQESDPDNGPCWMGGYGYGAGTPDGSGYDRRMMGGYGPAPGMMGGYGYGMGPGMEGREGYGMGPGMMPGYGGRPGYRHGWGYRNGYADNVTEEQRRKIDAIHQEMGRKRWELMGRMRQDQHQLNQLYRSGAAKTELDKAYQAVADDRKQMFDLGVETRLRVDAVVGQSQPQK